MRVECPTADQRSASVAWVLERAALYQTLCEMHASKDDLEDLLADLRTGHVSLITGAGTGPQVVDVESLDEQIKPLAIASGSWGGFVRALGEELIARFGLNAAFQQMLNQAGPQASDIVQNQLAQACGGMFGHAPTMTLAHLAGAILGMWQGDPGTPFSQALSLLARNAKLCTLNHSHHIAQAVEVGGQGHGRRFPMNFLEYCMTAGLDAHQIEALLVGPAIGPAGHILNHFALHLHGEVFDDRYFVLTNAEYQNHLQPFRQYVSLIAKNTHMIGIGIGAGFLDNHFQAVWAEQRDLQCIGKQVQLWKHFIILTKSGAASFVRQIEEDVQDIQLQNWIKDHIQIIIYGEDYNELAPCVHHLAVAGFKPM